MKRAVALPGAREDQALALEIDAVGRVEPLIAAPREPVNAAVARRRERRGPGSVWLEAPGEILEVDVGIPLLSTTKAAAKRSGVSVIAEGRARASRSPG